MQAQQLLSLQSFVDYTGKADDLIEKGIVLSGNFVDFLASQSFSDLGNLAYKIKGVVDQLLIAMDARGRLEDHWGPYLSLRDSALKEQFENLQAGGPGSDAIKATMLDKLKDLSGDAAIAQQILDSLLAGNESLFESRKITKAALSSEVDLLLDMHNSLNGLVYRSLFESKLGQAYENAKASPVVGLAEGDHQVIDAETAKLVAVLDSTVSGLYDLLDNKVDIAEFSSYCAAQSETIITIMPTASLVLGGGVGLASKATDATAKVGHYEKLIALTEVILKLGVVYAYLGLAKAELKGLDPNRWYSNEKRRIDGRVAESKAPQGKEVSLGSLDAEDTGEFVKISGFVDEIKIDDDPSPPKFSTFFDLIDPVSGDKVLVRAHMFNLINNGIEDGTYLELNGFVRKNERWVSGTGVDIDRVSLTELRRESFFDDITHRVKDYFLLYNKEMNLFATPE